MGYSCIYTDNAECDMSFTQYQLIWLLLKLQKRGKCQPVDFTGKVK